MKYQIFRNFTLEPLFKGIDYVFSDYSDISYIDESVERYIWFYLPLADLSFESDRTEMADYQQMLELVISRINPAKKIFLLTARNLYDVRANLKQTSFETQVAQYNQALYEWSATRANVYVLDTETFFRNYTAADLLDWKYFFLSRMMVNPKLAKPFGQWFAAQVAQVDTRLKKCLLLDLDNTLWGGILGEDGISGVRCNGDYPGNVYELFQKFLLSLKKQGVMLAMCSKNNEADVLELFEKNPNMILQLTDFVDWEINWNNKAENIQILAKRLNIGLDSMVFVDDNPMEREFVQISIPALTVPSFPEQLFALPTLMQELNTYFTTTNITQEDLNKTRQYKENASREKFRNSFADMDAFIDSLNIELLFSGLNDFTIDRYVQLTQKTNQFNLTTRRYTKEDFLRMDSEGVQFFGVQVRDKFGDYGIVGLAITRSVSDCVQQLDTFLLSCRVLGKGIEASFLAYIVSFLKEKGATELKADYVRSAKNSQVANFFEQYGFQVIMETESGKSYIIALENFTTNKKFNHRIAVI